MYEVEKDGECIIEYLGYVVCCLNMWVFFMVVIGLKIKVKKFYLIIKIVINVVELE